MNRRELLVAAAWPAAAQGGRIRAAMIGTRHSHAAGKLKAMLESPLYEVAGVVEEDAAARAAARKQPLYNDVRWMTADEMLGDRSIQAVAVEDEVWKNFPWARRVIAAGKHLHLEKPPINALEPFGELIDEARRKGLLVQVGYIWRFHETVNRAIEIAKQGWLGDVYLLRAVINTDIDAESRRDVARYRGGIMYELGCHQIDRVVALWGKPRAVKSWLRHDTRVPDSLADTTLAVLEYDRSLAVVSTAAKMAGSSAHRSFELMGTDGWILIQPVEPGTRLRLHLRQAMGPYAAGLQEVQFAPQVRYRGDFADLARAILHKQPLQYSYDFELAVQETLLRAAGEMA